MKEEGMRKWWLWSSSFKWSGIKREENELDGWEREREKNWRREERGIEEEERELTEEEERERGIEGERNDALFLLGLHLKAISKYLVSEWNPGSCPNRDSGPQILILESAASLLVENVHFRLLLHVASTICWKGDGEEEWEMMRGKKKWRERKKGRGRDDEKRERKEGGERETSREERILSEEGGGRKKNSWVLLERVSWWNHWMEKGLKEEEEEENE